MADVILDAPFPQIDLMDGSYIRVNLQDPGAVLTEFIIHGIQDAGGPLSATGVVLQLLPDQQA
jgi:hypothetical protein